MSVHKQATKANPAQVYLHIQRQRALGERMIGDHDQPGKWELIVTLAIIVAIVLMKV